METMQVYRLTIQENGHSRRFVYEDRRSRSPSSLDSSREMSEWNGLWAPSTATGHPTMP